jgi:hypothetical protein
MGNAYVAVADDFNALFYNPAGLARLSDWHLEVVNPKVSMSKTTYQLLEDSDELSGSGTVSTVVSTFEKMSGKTNHISVGVTPVFVYPGFGIGIGADAGGTLAIHRDVSVDVDAGIDVIVPIGFAKNFLEDRLSLGAAAKFVMRNGVYREFSVADISAFTKKSDDSSGKKLSDYVQGGKGVGFDVGMLFTPVKTMEPTLGVSVTDLGGTAFDRTESEAGELGQLPPRLPSVNTGVSFKPVKKEDFYLLTSVDAHAINQPLHYSKKFNVGSEVGLWKFLKFQAGLHQGTLSGGMELDVKLLIIRFATYAEQVGTTSSQAESLTDRRYVAQLKMLL